MKIERNTIVYHTQFGKGWVLSIKYRKNDNLYACYFPEREGCEFITHEQLVSGGFEIGLKPVIQVKRKAGESLEDILGGLLRSS